MDKILTPSDVLKNEMATSGITNIAALAEKLGVAQYTAAKILDESDRLRLSSIRDALKPLGFEVKLVAVKAAVN